MLPDEFFTLHRDLPREGPGLDDATREAIRRLPPLPASPRILDMGCGPGRQTLVLARELGGTVIALDCHAPYLDRLRHAAEAEGLADRLEARLGRMEAPGEAPGTIDLIWAEGSIYLLGFAEGLAAWRPLLRDGGLLVASEATWLAAEPPAEARAFWDEAYPAMTSVEGNIKLAAGAGFEVFHHFPLPQSGWWEDYLGPLEARAEALRPQSETNPTLARLLEETRREIEIVRRFGDAFGYVFYLMRKA